MEIEISVEYSDETGTVKAKIYHKKDTTSYWHREDGPACTYYDESGNIVLETYWVNNTLYRDDGPARVKYDRDGNIEWVDFVLNNERLTEEEWLEKTKFKRRLKGTLLENKY